MKTKLISLILLSFLFLFSDCKKGKEDSRSVMDLGTPGNTWTGRFSDVSR